MKKLLIILILLLVLPSVLAVPQTLTLNPEALTIATNIPTAISQNITREFEVHVLNLSKIITSATCSLHIYDTDGDGGHLYRGTNSSFDEFGDLEFVVNASVHSTKGQYSYKVLCNSSSQAGLFESVYYVTKTGKEPAKDLFIVFIYLLFIFSTIGLFSTFFITIAKVATADSTVLDVIITWGFFILNVIVVHLSEEYLISAYVENLANFFVSLTTWTNGVLPLIAFIISIIFRSLKEKRPLGMYEINGWRFK